MSRKRSLEELKKEIESKRERLNEMVRENIGDDDVLRFSTELDDLIMEYYELLKFNKK